MPATYTTNWSPTSCPKHLIFNPLTSRTENVRLYPSSVGQVRYVQFLRAGAPGKPRSRGNQAVTKHLAVIKFSPCNQRLNIKHVIFKAFGLQTAELRIHLEFFIGSRLRAHGKLFSTCCATSVGGLTRYFERAVFHETCPRSQGSVRWQVSFTKLIRIVKVPIWPNE